MGFAALYNVSEVNSAPISGNNAMATATSRFAARYDSSEVEFAPIFRKNAMAIADEPSLDAIIGQIERLPDDERERLFAWVVSQFARNPSSTPGLSEDDPGFQEEIDRRITEMEEGTVNTYSLDEVKGYVDEQRRESRSRS